jgi:LacI family transcriptional regulator
MDDTEIGQVFKPSLTSVSLGSRERGRAAARLMLDRVDDGAQEHQHVVVGPQLVVRESSPSAPTPGRDEGGTR